MKKKILLIRSVSLQQLDKNLPQIYKQFPDCEFYLLTHTHNIENCSKYKGIKKVLDYKKKTSFHPFFIDKNLKNEKFDSVIYFVSNIKGFGFLNVSLFAQRLSKGSVYCCNLNSKIKKQSKLKTLICLIKASIFLPISIILTIPTIAIGLSFILFYLIKNLKFKT